MSKTQDNCGQIPSISYKMDGLSMLLVKVLSISNSSQAPVGITQQLPATLQMWQLLPQGLLFITCQTSEHQFWSGKNRRDSVHHWPATAPCDLLPRAQHLFVLFNWARRWIWAHPACLSKKRVSSTRRTGQENTLVVYWAEFKLYRSIGQSCCWDMRFAQHHQRAAHLRVLHGTGTFSFYRPSKSSQGWAGWLQRQAREWNLHWKMQFDSKYFCKLKSNARHRFGQKKYRKEFETF